MCVWAGYIGRNEAAPIVHGMIRKIEGLWSGHYSGLVTVDADGFHSGKVVGATRCWDKEYRLADFPGKTGLFHSRTMSGGDREWAHPFVSPTGTIAVVAQGHAGIFSDRKRLFVEAGNRILDSGRHFTSANYSIKGNYIVLKDGGEVHFSEIVEQAVDLEYVKCGNPLEAIRRGFGALPLESVFVFVFRDVPGAIFVATVNQRAVFSQADDGLYAATTSLAFPGNCTRVTEVPGNTVAELRMGKAEFTVFDASLEVSGAVPDGLEPAFTQYVEQHPGCCLAHVVDNALKPLFKRTGIECEAVSGYRILEKLVAGGRIRLETVDCRGVDGDRTGAMTQLYPT